jgi:hypothetical protein
VDLGAAGLEGMSLPNALRAIFGGVAGLANAMRLPACAFADANASGVTTGSICQLDSDSSWRSCSGSAGNTARPRDVESQGYARVPWTKPHPLHYPLFGKRGQHWRFGEQLLPVMCIESVGQRPERDDEIRIDTHKAVVQELDEGTGIAHGVEARTIERNVDASRASSERKWNANSSCGEFSRLNELMIRILVGPEWSAATAAKDRIRKINAAATRP